MKTNALLSEALDTWLSSFVDNLMKTLDAYHVPVLKRADPVQTEYLTRIKDEIADVHFMHVNSSYSVEECDRMIDNFVDFMFRDLVLDSRIRWIPEHVSLSDALELILTVSTITAEIRKLMKAKVSELVSVSRTQSERAQNAE